MRSSSNTSTFAKGSHPLHKFSIQIFSPYGRTNRAKFWLAYLIGLGIILAAVAVAILGDLSEKPSLIVIATGMPLGIAIYVLAGIRRLHDRDKSGHWLWLFYLAPRLIGRFASELTDLAESTGELVIAGIGALIAVGLFIWGLIEMGFRRGTPGPNRYGPDPLQDKQSLAAASPQ